MIDRNRALEMIAENRTNEVVVTTMSTARTWPAFSSCPDLDFPLRGCMGKASSLGLGLALARPDVRVLVLDGDGSLLMNLGSLVTVAGSGAQEPRPRGVRRRDLRHERSGQPTPGRGPTDLAALAKVAGYRRPCPSRRTPTWTAVAGPGQADGPTFVRLHVPSMWVTRDMPSATGGGWTAVAKALASEGAA